MSRKIAIAAIALLLAAPACIAYSLLIHETLIDIAIAAGGRKSSRNWL